MKHTRIILIGGLLLQAGVCRAQDEPPASAGPHEQVVRELSRLCLKKPLRSTADPSMLTIEATVNGQTGLFLLDTGSQVNTVNAAGMRRLGLQFDPDQAPDLVEGVGGRQEVRAVKLDSFSFGDGIETPNPSFLAGIEEHGSPAGKPSAWDGSIGIGLLGRAGAVLSLSEREAFFPLPENAEAVNKLLSSAKGWDALALRPHRRTRLQLVQGFLNEKEATFMVDLACEQTVLLMQRKDRFDLDLIPSGIGAHGVGGMAEKSWVASVDSFRLGPHFRIGRLPVTGLDLSHLPLNEKHTKTPVDGILGMDVLCSSAFLHDIGNKRLLVPRGEQDGVGLGIVPGVLPFTGKTLTTLTDDSLVIAEATPTGMDLPADGARPAVFGIRLGKIYCQAGEFEEGEDVSMEVPRERAKELFFQLQDHMNRSRAGFLYLQLKDGTSHLLRNGALRENQVKALVMEIKESADSK